MNVAGQAYGLTMLCPILGGVDSTGLHHDAALRAVLAAMPSGATSPFARLPNVHLARWVVIDDAFYEDYPEAVDHYASKYLLFTACFDGALEPFLDALRTKLSAEVVAVWSHCVGFPGLHDGAGYMRYMKACQVETTFLFAAYPDVSLPRVLRALDTQRRFLAFLAAHQNEDDVALQQAFGRFMTELAHAPTPAPASV